MQKEQINHQNPEKKT